MVYHIPMIEAVIGIVLLLISGLVGAFLYIRKLRAKSAESAKKLQDASSQVTSLQTNLKDQEASAEREAQQLKEQAKASSEKLEEEKKAKKAELSAKQKRHEAEIAKTDERRKAALKEADAARAKANAARIEADRAITAAKRSKQLADTAKRVADQRAKQAQAKQTVVKAEKAIGGGPPQVKGVNINRTFEDAARYDAVPGYYKSGHVWAGDHFNVSDPNVCKALAKQKGLAVWGHRNVLHPDKRYKNSCYFYKSGPKYEGDGNDRIHMIGCTYGGNPKTGCNSAVTMGVKKHGGVRVGRRTKRSFTWSAVKSIDFPGNDLWKKVGRDGSTNREQSLSKCKQDNKCAGVTCTNDGRTCWGKHKLWRSERHGDRITYRAQRV